MKRAELSVRAPAGRRGNNDSVLKLKEREGDSHTLPVSCKSKHKIEEFLSLVRRNIMIKGVAVVLGLGRWVAVVLGLAMVV